MQRWISSLFVLPPVSDGWRCEAACLISPDMAPAFTQSTPNLPDAPLNWHMMPLLDCVAQVGTLRVSWLFNVCMTGFFRCVHPPPDKSLLHLNLLQWTSAALSGLYLRTNFVQLMTKRRKSGMKHLFFSLLLPLGKVGFVFFLVCFVFWNVGLQLFCHLSQGQSSKAWVCLICQPEFKQNKSKGKFCNLLQQKSAGKLLFVLSVATHSG